MPTDSYNHKLISPTADGANVNLGIYNGVLMRMKRERPWLITIDCENHRLELAIKDEVLQIEAFKECDRF